MPIAADIMRLLDLIVCPACRGPLSLNEPDTFLLCDSCGHKYSIRDGIPVLIAGRAAE